jgi:hypothetical protein
MQGIYRVTEDVLASPERHCCLEVLRSNVLTAMAVKFVVLSGCDTVQNGNVKPSRRSILSPFASSAEACRLLQNTKFFYLEHGGNISFETSNFCQTTRRRISEDRNLQSNSLECRKTAMQDTDVCSTHSRRQTEHVQGRDAC